MLTGAITSPDSLTGKADMRSTMPRFQGENFARNTALVDKFSAVAESKGCTPGQLALVWLLAQGDYVAPIPGTKRVSYLEENAAATNFALSKEELVNLETLFAPDNIAGDRYAKAGMRSLDRD
jgi:aryl-alcohol dehydrogenase-like predicted oxidoreductase